MDKIKNIFVFILLFIFCLSYVSALNFDDKVKFMPNAKYGKYEIYNSKLLLFQGEKEATYELIENNYDVFKGWAVINVTLFKPEEIMIDVGIYGKNNIRKDDILLDRIIYFEDGKSEKYINGKIYPIGNYTIKLLGKREDTNTGVRDWVITTGAGNKVLDKWANWWDFDWGKKVQINISENTGNTWTNYSVRFNITYDADMQSNFGDIRFINASESGEWPYWIEKQNNGVNATIWVKIANLTGNQNTSIYMYYNNPSVNTTSNALEAFLFYDNASTDRRGEYIVAGSGGSFVWASGEYYYDDNAGGIPYGGVYPANISVANISLQISTKDVGPTGFYNAIAVRAQSYGSTNVYRDGVFSGSGKIRKVVSSVESDISTAYSLPGYVQATYANRTFFAFGNVLNTTWILPNGTFIASKQATDTTFPGAGGAGVHQYDDGRTYWNYIRLREFGNPEPSVVLGQEESVNLLDVTLNYPEEYANFTFSNIQFNLSCTDDVGCLNITLVLDGKNNYTAYNTTAGENISLVTNVSGIYEGIHNWTGIVCDDLVCRTTAERYFTIHTTAPNVSVTYPSGFISYVPMGENLSLNYNISESGQNISTHLDKCWFVYNSITNLINCSQNTTSFEYVPGINNLTTYANDTYGLIGSNFTSWTLLFENYNVTYDNTTYEGSQESFTADVILGSGYTISEAIFYYNNTNYTTNINYDSGEYMITSSILIPSVELDTNMTFGFLFNVGGTYYDLESFNQTVLDINMSLCGGGDPLVLNMSLHDEVSKNLITGTIEVNAEAISKTSSYSVGSVNTNFTNVSSGSICLSPSEAFSNLYLDAEIKYYSEGYSPELYYIQSADMTDYPKNLSLFDLNSTYSTDFIVTYQDDNLITVPEAAIQLQRKYINEGIYEIVEAPLTSDSGKVVLHIDLRSNKYKATIVKDGEVLDIFDNIVFSCDNALVGECTQSLLGKIDAQNDISLVNLKDFSYYLTTTNNSITTTFTIPSGSPSSVNIQLDQIDMFGNTTRCNQTVVSSGGSIACSYNASIGDSILDLKIYKDGDPQATEGFLVRDDPGFSGSNFLIFVAVILSLAGIASASPIAIVFTTVISFFIAGALWLINGFDFVIGLGAFVEIIGVAIVIIYKMSKQEDR